MQETALYTQDSWELGHCTIVYDPINIPGLLMEESLYVPDEEAAPCPPELALRGTVVLVKGLLHTGLWRVRGFVSFASLQIDFCHFKLLSSPSTKAHSSS